MSIITPSARAVRPLPLLRPAKPILFASLILAVPMLAHAQEAEETGEPLYIVKGCLGCHGASARGGVGPSLAKRS